MRRGLPSLILVLLLVTAFAFWAWSFGAPTAAPAAGASPAATRPATLSAMAANIRYSTESDGLDAWSNRREFVVKTFLKYQPDFLGCQEVTPAQRAYLNKELAPLYAGYPAVGVPASSQGARAELLQVVRQSLASLNTLYYRADRFELLDGESGLLIPEHPQVIATENTYFTLAVLKEKTGRDGGAGAGATYLIIDEHLRHQNGFAVQCALRVRQKIAAWLARYPDAGVIVIGDMNHDRTAPPYSALVTGAAGAKPDGSPPLIDTFDYTRKPAGTLWGTYHGFKGLPLQEWPSDLIFIAGPLQVAEPAEILRDKTPAGHYPSDHFFILTRIARKQ